MQKSIIAFLALVVLLLSAALLRLQNREQQLEARLAAAERVRSPRQAPPLPVPAPEVAPATISKPLPPEDRARMEEKPQATAPSPSPKVLGPGLTSSYSNDPLALSTPGEPLPEGRRPGFLGITGIDEEGGGVQVMQVQQGTVAGLSGLQVGDVILDVNGEHVANYGDLAAKMRRYGEGGPVTLRIRRGTVEFYQGAQLGPRPP